MKNKKKTGRKLKRSNKSSNVRIKLGTYYFHTCVISFVYKFIQDELTVVCLVQIRDFRFFFSFFLFVKLPYFKNTVFKLFRFQLSRTSSCLLLSNITYVSGKSRRLVDHHRY